MPLAELAYMVVGYWGQQKKGWGIVQTNGKPSRSQHRSEDYTLTAMERSWMTSALCVESLQ